MVAGLFVLDRLGPCALPLVTASAARQNRFQSLTSGQPTITIWQSERALTSHAVAAMPDNPILWLLLGALGIALLVYERGRLQAWLRLLSVGPLFWYDLARLARRNRTSLVAICLWLAAPGLA